MTRNGGQLLVDCLMALGARRCFGVPGESYLAVLDALHDTRGRLDYTLCRQEGGAAYMAAAYGKLTGRPGICFVTRGPGSTNAAIGVHTAMQDSAPMILFVGQVGTDMRGREAFQELDYRAVFGSMAKWSTEIDQVERIPEILSRAWTQAISGRPGPVVIALPEDMLTSLTDVDPLRGPVVVQPSMPSTQTLARVEEMLVECSRPLILIGGCNWTAEASQALQAFAETSDIPVIAAFRYQDQFDNYSEAYCGEAGVGMPPHVRHLLSECDCLLAINVRFGEMTTDGYRLLKVPRPRQRLIHVHASDLELGKIYQPELAIHTDHNQFALSLNKVSGQLAGMEGRGPFRL